MRFRARISPGAAAVLGVALFAFAYARTLPLPFLSDDWAIAAYHERAEGPLAFLRDPFLGIQAGTEGASRYRPALALSWAGDRYFFHANPVGYRLHGFLLHLLCGAAVAALGTRLARRAGFAGRAEGAGAAAGLLFVLHPLHPNALVWVISRGDPLSTLFLLLALIFFDRHRCGGGGSSLAFALGAATLAYFAKETTLVLPLLVALLEGTRPRSPGRARRALLYGALFAAPLAAYLLARSAVAGSALPSSVLEALRALSPSLLGKALAGALVSRARLLFAPVHDSLPPLVATAALVSLTVLAAFPALRWRKAFLGFLLASLLALLPSLYVWVDPAEHFNARVLHLPAAGIALALGLAAFRGRRPALRVLPLALAFAAVARGNASPWLRAGEEMRAIRSACVEGAAQATRVVVLDAPERLEGVPVFLNAGNFLLAPPHGAGAAVFATTKEGFLEFTRLPDFPAWRRAGLAVVRQAGGWRARTLARDSLPPDRLAWTPQTPGPWIVEASPEGPSFAGTTGVLIARGVDLDPLRFGRLVLGVEGGGPSARPFLATAFAEGKAAATIRAETIPVFSLDLSLDWLLAGRIEDLALEIPPGWSGTVREIALESAPPPVRVLSPGAVQVLQPEEPLRFSLEPPETEDRVELVFVLYPGLETFRADVPRPTRAGALWILEADAPGEGLGERLREALSRAEGIAWYAERRAGDSVTARSEVRWLRVRR